MAVRMLLAEHLPILVGPLLGLQPQPVSDRLQASVLLDLLFSLTGEDTLQELSVLSRVLFVLEAKPEKTQEVIALEEKTKEKAAILLGSFGSEQQLKDHSFTRLGVSRLGRSEIMMEEEKMNKAKEFLEKVENRTKVELVTILMTLKTHARMAALKTVLSKDLSWHHSQDISEIHHLDESHVTNIDSVIAPTLPTDRSAEKHRRLSIPDNSEDIEEFLRYEAESREETSFISRKLSTPKAKQQKETSTQKSGVISKTRPPVPLPSSHLSGRSIVNEISLSVNKR